MTRAERYNLIVLVHINMKEKEEEIAEEIIIENDICFAYADAMESLQQEEAEPLAAKQVSKLIIG